MRSAIHIVAWGLFCACSWTWCIGMYLPKVMLDRFGLAGFLVFAVPNVVGCAGFGYVLAGRRRSAAMVERHGRAMLGFSVVAIAYHVFFGTFLFGEILASSSSVRGPIIAVLVIILPAGVLAFGTDRNWLVLAALTYAFSLVGFGVIGLGAWDRILEPGELPPGRLVWLSPVVAAGFLLCPYLDLTFHRAVQRSPSRHAFGVFGAAFAVMIVFTCFLWFARWPVLPWIGVAHILVQMVFTVGAHLRELRVSPMITHRGARLAVMLVPLAAVFILPASKVMTEQDFLGERIYLRFLVFYGLVFPAYVLLFIGPWRRWGLTRSRLAVFGLIVVALGPLYELGFIGGQTWLLSLPVAVAVLWGVLRQLGGRADS